MKLQSIALVMLAATAFALPGLDGARSIMKRQTQLDEIRDCNQSNLDHHCARFVSHKTANHLKCCSELTPIDIGLHLHGHWRLYGK